MRPYRPFGGIGSDSHTPTWFGSSAASVVASVEKTQNGSPFRVARYVSASGLRHSETDGPRPRTRATGW